MRFDLVVRGAQGFLKKRSLLRVTLNERELAPVCLRYGIGVLPYSPLAGGFLTGKYRRNQPLPASVRAEGKCAAHGLGPGHNRATARTQPNAIPELVKIGTLRKRYPAKEVRRSCMAGDREAPEESWIHGDPWDFSIRSRLGRPTQA
jgi:hypothetical protein